MSNETVVFDAACDGCSGIARWRGVKTDTASGTRYVITCPNCGTAPPSSVELRKQPKIENVENNEARDHWQRLTGWRTA